MTKSKFFTIIMCIGLFLPGTGSGAELPQSQLMDLFKKSMPALYSYIPAFNLHEWATNWINNLRGTEKYTLYATLATALGVTAYTGYLKITQRPEIKHLYSPEFVQKLADIVVKTQKIYDLPLSQHPATKIESEYKAILTKNMQSVVEEFEQIILPTLEKKESLNFLENSNGWVYLAKRIIQKNTAHIFLQNPSKCLQRLFNLLSFVQDLKALQENQTSTITRLRNSLLAQQINLAHQSWVLTKQLAYEKLIIRKLV